VGVRSVFGGYFQVPAHFDGIRSSDLASFWDTYSNICGHNNIFDDQLIIFYGHLTFNSQPSWLDFTVSNTILEHTLRNLLPASFDNCFSMNSPSVLLCLSSSYLLKLNQISSSCRVSCGIGVLVSTKQQKIQKNVSSFAKSPAVFTLSG
jgi:hypothetical protein